MTRGLDLNNPMNLMENNIRWAFQIRPTRDPDGRLAQFRSMEDGLHAGIENLLNQQLLHGLNTWHTIISKFAPPDENDTAAYIKNMCDATGVQANDPIDLRNVDFLETSSIMMIKQEQGQNPITEDQIAQICANVVASTTKSAKT